jgi:hypothetical protein
LSLFIRILSLYTLSSISVQFLLLFSYLALNSFLCALFVAKIRSTVAQQQHTKGVEARNSLKQLESIKKQKQQQQQH